MHLRKAFEKLWNMVDDGEPNDVGKLAKVAMLIDGFDRAAADAPGAGYAREKIHAVRTGFEILCGVGEDIQADTQFIVDVLRGALGKLERVISEDGLHVV